MGIFGAGIAMSITSSIMLMLKIVYLTQRNFHCYNLFKFHKNILTYVVPVFKMGIPISIQQSSEILFFTVITYFMGIAGVGALVAQQISGQITIVVVSVVIAVSQSVSILIAHNIKRNNSDNIRDFIQIALAVGTIIATMVLVVCVFFPQLPVRLYFKHGMHPADAFPLTKAVLCITGVYLLFDSIRNIVVGALRGFGDTKISMRISLVAFWCIALPLSYIFYQFSPLGAVGIKLGGMIAIIPATLYICYRLRQVQTSFSNG